MKQDAEKAVALEGLSARQQQLAERHLGLVQLTVRRFVHARSADRSDLLQEGFIALAEAVRNHDPARHGSFPAYAMARVRFAVSRFLHEETSLIRVPYITQRRRRRRETDPSPDRHRPDALPHIVSGGLPSSATLRQRRHDGECQSTAEDMPRLGDLARACYDRAVRQATIDLIHRHRNDPRRRKLVERCCKERWEIPDEECRTQLRKLARELALPLGTITRCEAGFSQRVAQALKSDDLFVVLQELARQKPRGWREPIESMELTALRRRFHLPG